MRRPLHCSWPNQPPSATCKRTASIQLCLFFGSPRPPAQHALLHVLSHIAQSGARACARAICETAATCRALFGTSSVSFCPASDVGSLSACLRESGPAGFGASATFTSACSSRTARRLSPIAGQGILCNSGKRSFTCEQQQSTPQKLDNNTITFGTLQPEFCLLYSSTR
jgi:hypothetical protein